MSTPLSRVGTPGQKAATRALARFVREHDHAPVWVEHLEQFSRALESRDVYELKTLIQLLRRAGMGSFRDWGPKTLPGEDPEYVECVWNALYGYWFQQVEPITKVEHRGD
jgi:hypothetical protein